MSRYTLLVTPWGHPKVTRTIALSGRHSLEQLHAAIIDAFDFEDDHLHAFFLNGHAWDREFGYFSRPDSGEKETASAKLDSLKLQQNQRFLYLFDYADEHRFGVRVANIEATLEGPNEPELLESVGVAPKPYPEDDGEMEAKAETTRVAEPDPAWRDLSDRIRVRLGPPEDVEQLALPEPAPTEQLSLANELLDRVGGDESMLDRIANWSGTAVVDWLIGLPNVLAREEKTTEALALSDRLSTYSFGELLEPWMALWAATENQRERAFELVESSLGKNPGDAAVLADLGVALERLGDAARAERCYREALRFAGTDLEFRRKTIATLVRLLESQGRSLEVKQLELSESRWRSRFLSTSAVTGVPQTVKNSAPKVGRNDPCPCGSSKKYKKCCGAAA